MHPAKPDTGIWFLRSDQSTPVRIPALVQVVAKRARRSALQNGTVAIETVEHCLSACSGMGIDNLEIELTGNELPALDGSCLPYAELIDSAGITEQQSERRSFIIDKVVRVADGDMELIALPPLDGSSDSLEILYDLDYGDQTPIGRQIQSFTLSKESFLTQIAPARTFVLKHEADALRTAGLGLHLTYQDIVVFGEDGPIENKLRFEDECVRHKILDLIGDLALVGRFLIGRVHARKSGHALNHDLARALCDRISECELAEFAASKPQMGIRDVKRILPHRYPFLLVDRVIRLDGARHAVGIKNVSINEAFFQGHYPDQPIMPGVLIIEAMAQLGGILLGQDLEHKGKVAVLFSLDKVKFRRAVTPGDQLILEADAIRVRGHLGHVRTRAKVGTELAAEAEIKFMLTDADESQ